MAVKPLACFSASPVPSYLTSSTAWRGGSFLGRRSRRAALRLCLLFMHVRFHGYQARNLCGIGPSPARARPPPGRPLVERSLDFTWRRCVRYEKVSNWFRLSCFRRSGHFPRAFSCALCRVPLRVPLLFLFFIFVCGCCEA